jgi:hypothetical protein
VGQVHLYILSVSSAAVGFLFPPSEYPASRKYGVVSSRAMLISALTPVAVSVFLPQMTMTWSARLILVRALSFQSADASLIEWSSMKNGESSFFACSTRNSFGCGSAAVTSCCPG